MRINFAWLLRLRWGAIAGQLATIVVADRWLGTRLPMVPLLAIVAASLAVNLAATVWFRRGQRVGEPALVALMATDILILTALLYFSGGPFNPFSFLYLVYIALAAIVLRERWTWALAALSLLGSGLLFVDHRELHIAARTHEQHMTAHLQGMWVAFGVAAAFIVYFLLRVRRELSAREAELAAANDLATRRQRLASLATLAAGAAHELATPLSTIATVAKELERSLGAAASPDAVTDVQLIRAEVERCRTILSHMTTDAGGHTGEAPAPVTVGALVAAAMEMLGPSPRIRVDVAGEGTLSVPQRALALAVKGILKNAQDASPADAEIVLAAALSGASLRIEVRDSGHGMAPDVLARAGEPFFTTKAPGAGMGLGLFLTRAIVEQLGGQLELASRPGQGTTVLLTLPAPPATTGRMARGA